ILDAVAKSNMIDSPGLIESGHQLNLTLVTGQARNADELAKVVIKNSQAGIPIRVGDVAAVHPAVIPVYTIVTANGKPGVLLNVFRQIDGNTLGVSQAVAEEVRQIRATLPPGMKLEPFYDQSVLVEDSIHSVRDAILIGLALAIVIMVLFLRDARSSLIAG